MRSVQTSELHCLYPYKRNNGIGFLTSNLWKTAGIRGFYKGALINVIGISPFVGIKLSMFDFLNKISNSKKNSP